MASVLQAHSGDPKIQELVEQFASELVFEVTAQLQVSTLGDRNFRSDERNSQAVRQLVSQHFAQAKDALRAWSVLLNHVSPVHTLPSDVLRSIFMFVEERAPLRKRGSKVEHRPTASHSSKNGGNRSNGPGRTRGWAEVMYVCRRWRLVALTSPELWTSVNVSLAGTPWMDRVMDRCGPERKLRLWIEGPEISTPESELQVYRELLWEKLPRASHLRLSLDQRTRFGWNRAPPSVSAPHLKVMDLETVGGEPGRTAAFTPIELSSPPLLEVLRARRVFESLRILTSGANLRHLELAEQHTVYRESVSRERDLRIFLDFLQTTPRLVYLSLENAGPSVISRADHQEGITPRIELPLLEVLHMRGTTSAYEILPHLYIPACVHVDVYFLRRSLSPYLELDLPFIIPQRQSPFWEGWQDEELPLHTMNLSVEAKGRGIRASYLFTPQSESTVPSTSVDEHPIVKSSGEVLRRRRLIFRFGTVYKEEVDEQLCAALSYLPKFALQSCMPSLKEFHVVNFQNVLSQEEWEDALGCMPGLSTVVLRRTDLPPLLDALGPEVTFQPGESLDEESKADSVRILCPLEKPEKVMTVSRRK